MKILSKKSGTLKVLDTHVTKKTKTKYFSFMEKYLAKIENHIFNNQNSKVRMFLFVEKPNVGSKLVCNDQLISYPNASEKDMLIIFVPTKPC